MSSDNNDNDLLLHKLTEQERQINSLLKELESKSNLANNNLLSLAKVIGFFLFIICLIIFNKTDVLIKIIEIIFRSN